MNHRTLLSGILAITFIGSGGCASGTLDSSFGPNGQGFVVWDSGAYEDLGNGVAIDPLGNILVAGESASLITLWRFDAAGNLDPGFGANGFVQPTPDPASGVALALDGAGNIFLAGSTTRPGSNVPDLFVWKFRSDGTLDGGFGIGGSFHMSGLDVEVRATAIEPDGRILVCATSSLMYTVVLGVDSSGQLDFAWGGDGLVDSMEYVIGRAIRIDAVGGRCYVLGRSLTGLVIRAYTLDGWPDLAFGSQGKVCMDGDVEGNDLAITSSGIVVVGYRFRPYWRATAWRFNRNGALDLFFLVEGSEQSEMRSIAVESTGRLLVAGSAFVGDSVQGNPDLCLWAITPDGALDTSFGTNGIVTHDSAAGGYGNDGGLAVALDSSERIVVAGFSKNAKRNYDLAVWRYQ